MICVPVCLRLWYCCCAQCAAAALFACFAACDMCRLCCLACASPGRICCMFVLCNNCVLLRRGVCGPLLAATKGIFYPNPFSAPHELDTSTRSGQLQSLQQQLEKGPHGWWTTCRLKTQPVPSCCQHSFILAVRHGNPMSLPVPVRHGNPTLTLFNKVQHHNCWPATRPNNSYSSRSPTYAPT